MAKSKAQHQVADRRWRKVYDSILDGFRINQIPYDAQVFFWKIQHIADDFGNFKLLPSMLASVLYPESPDDIRPGAARVSEMVALLANVSNKAGMPDPLVTTYQVDGDTFVHICEYLLRQSPSNGQHAHKVPASPTDAADLRELNRDRKRAKESQVNRSNPKVSQDNLPDIQIQTKNKNKRENNSKSKRGAAAVAGFVLSEQEEADAKSLSKRPEWLKDGQGWYDIAAAREIIAMRLPNATVATTIRSARASRLNLANPAGWIRSELVKAAEGLRRGGAA